jgi:hypothetical protein
MACLILPGLTASESLSPRVKQKSFLYGKSNFICKYKTWSYGLPCAPRNCRNFEHSLRAKSKSRRLPQNSLSAFSVVLSKCLWENILKLSIQGATNVVPIGLNI